MQAVIGKAIAIEKLVPNLVCLHKQSEGSALPGSRYCKMPGTENLREFMVLKGNYRVCPMGNGHG